MGDWNSVFCYCEVFNALFQWDVNLVLWNKIWLNVFIWEIKTVCLILRNIFSALFLWDVNLVLWNKIGIIAQSIAPDFFSTTLRMVGLMIANSHIVCYYGLAARGVVVSRVSLWFFVSSNFSQTHSLSYGCEVWVTESADIIEKIHLRFCKYVLQVNKSICFNMVYDVTRLVLNARVGWLCIG